MADTDDTSPLNPGDRFGDYAVERLLGKGSMGAVYLMRSPEGASFAVKIMHRGKMSHDLRVRFAREAEFAMNIRHRNLVSVYDVGEDPDTGLCYIIMEYIPGGTLADRIRERGSIPIGEAVKITMHVAAALDVAHKGGLVHRDVKPDNIMFTADGTSKLADLGVAKFGDDRSTMVTTTGMIIGTPAYMSPEQLIDSHNIDTRSDIYSLGVVLYEMLSGKRPNSGSTSVELLAKAIKGEPLPDIRTMRPETSAAVAHVLSLMCAPKPDDRPATSVDAARLLQKAAEGKLVLPRKPPRIADVEAREARRRFLATAVVGGVLFFAAAVAFSWHAIANRRSSPPASMVFTNDVERIKVVTNVIVRDVVREKSSRHTRPIPRSAPHAAGVSVESGDAASRTSPFERRDRHHGSEPAPGWITIAPSETFDIHMTLESSTTGDGNVSRVLCSYYPQTNKYQTVRWYGGVPNDDLFDKLPETGDVYMRVFDKGCHLIDVDIACDFNVLCNKIKVDFSKIDGAVPYDTSTFEYKTFTRDWRTEDPKTVRISLTHPWIVARRDEILQSVGNDHVDYAYRAYSIVSDGFVRSGHGTDISETINRKSGDDVALVSVFVSLLRSAGIPARTLFGKMPDGNVILCPEFYVEGSGWIPADILKDVGHGKEARHFGVYDNACVILSSDLDVTIKEARGDPCHLERLWFCWWWLYSGAWTPCDTRFSWSGAATTEQGYRSRLDKMRNAKTMPSDGNGAKQFVLFPRLDRSPAAWAYSFDEEKGWKEPHFDDSGWKRAPGGFGRRERNVQLSRARLNTEWDTKAIFLRKRFTWNGGDVSRAVVDAYHDDDVTIWLNGRLMMTANDSNSDCQPFEIPARRFNKALRKGENVFCAEVRNNWNCQYFDCGLLVESGGVPAPHAGPDCMKKVKTDVGTWTVIVKDGIAQIGNGTDVALTPRPKGRLVIPSMLDGLQIGKLASNCFRECNDIESVVVPEGVRSVGQSAFFNCKRLSEMTIPESLEHLGIEALHDTRLRRIALKNVRLLEGGVFKFCESLNKVSVSPDNLTFVVKDGVLYDKIRRAVAFCPRSRKAYAFPAGIEDIYDSAFQRCKIRNIVIPETVQCVGYCAFNECPLLETVRFKGKDAILCSWAFGNTPSLKSVALPSRLKSLDDWAIFNHAGRLESIILPDTVEDIGDGVFENCPMLKSISLGKSLRRVGHHAFTGCSQLQSVEFPGALRQLGAEVFQNCISLKTVSFAGDAPELKDQDEKRLGEDIYKGANPSLVTIVPKDAKGWAGDSGRLPKAWPVAAGESARAIRHASGKSKGRLK
ncbi:MAG: leucine-rich repeat protein [Kiritimatiellae bacterium]|nr:leucine-rich repeat protein [Kiritimatiellia bacterium]